MDDALSRRWHLLFAGMREVGFQGLTPGEQTWYLVRGLIDAIHDGGLSSYFYNHGADNLAACLAALEELEADDVRAQVDRVCALFPGGVPADIEARNAVIRGWSAKGRNPRVRAVIDDVDRILMPRMKTLEAQLHGYLAGQGIPEAAGSA